MSESSEDRRLKAAIQIINELKARIAQLEAWAAALEQSQTRRWDR